MNYKPSADSEIIGSKIFVLNANMTVNGSMNIFIFFLRLVLHLCILAIDLYQ